jgi:hypothetical protein
LALCGAALALPRGSVVTQRRLSISVPGLPTWEAKIAFPSMIGRVLLSPWYLDCFP